MHNFTYLYYYWYLYITSTSPMDKDYMILNDTINTTISIDKLWVLFDFLCMNRLIDIEMARNMDAKLQKMLDLTE